MHLSSRYALFCIDFGIFPHCKRCLSISLLELAVEVGLVFIADASYHVADWQARALNCRPRSFHSLVDHQLLEALAKKLLSEL